MSKTYAASVSQPDIGTVIVMDANGVPVLTWEKRAVRACTDQGWIPLRPRDWHGQHRGVLRPCRRTYERSDRKSV